MNKNQKIKNAINATRAKRSQQKCVVLKFKINAQKLKADQRDQLKMMFIEGKWLYNAIVAKANDRSYDLKTFNPLIKTVIHFDKDRNEITSDLNYIPAACKQSLYAQVWSSLKTIRTLIKRGYQKHGKLKFTRELTALNFKQFGKTHQICSSTTMKLAGVRGRIKVSGLQQLKKFKNIEFANAKLLNTPSGYYIALTCYIPKPKSKRNTGKKGKRQTENVIGLDFGCQTSITDSNGNKMNFTFEESEQLKRLQRKLARKDRYARKQCLKNGKKPKVSYSNRRKKLTKRINKYYQRISNKKNDTANKYVATLKTYAKVVIQDEQLANWQKRGHGKAVQHSCLGRIKAKLKQQPNVVVLDKFIPTTKMCFECGNKNYGLTQRDRVFVCPNCQNESDRDIHAAKNMVWIYENLVGRDAAEFTLKEFNASVSKHHFDGAESKHSDVDLRRCSVFS